MHGLTPGTGRRQCRNVGEGPGKRLAFWRGEMDSAALTSLWEEDRVMPRGASRTSSPVHRWRCRWRGDRWRGSTPCDDSSKPPCRGLQRTRHTRVPPCATSLSHSPLAPRAGRAARAARPARHGQPATEWRWQTPPRQAPCLLGVGPSVLPGAPLPTAATRGPCQSAAPAVLGPPCAWSWPGTPPAQPHPHSLKRPVRGALQRPPRARCIGGAAPPGARRSVRARDRGPCLLRRPGRLAPPRPSRPGLP